MAESSISIKLLIDTEAKRLLFAEASKDFVDFLFHIISLPVATIINLLGKQGMVGSLGNLYESIENLNESYVQPNQNLKETLLKPAYTGSSAPLLLLNDGSSTGKKFYSCSRCGNYVSCLPNTTCPRCDYNMSKICEYVVPQLTKAAEEGGFVKGVVTYMVMDDLVVTPMSTISSITLLNKFNVKEVGALEEKVVNLGMNEAVKLLKASLETKNVLTEVFLK